MTFPLCRYVASVNQALATTNRTETKTPLVKNLIGRVRAMKYAARAARTLEESRALLSKQQRKNNQICGYEDNYTAEYL